MSSPVAFFVTWAQLEALRSMPLRGESLTARDRIICAAIAAKGLAVDAGGFWRATHRGEALIEVARGLAQS